MPDRTGPRLVWKGQNQCREGFLYEVALSLSIGICSLKSIPGLELNIAEVELHSRMQFPPLHLSCSPPFPLTSLTRPKIAISSSSVENQRELG